MQVNYIDHMGSDLSVINSAYASFNRRVDTFDPVRHPRLIRYLATGMAKADLTDFVTAMCDVDDPNIIFTGLDDYRHTPTHFSVFCHATITLQLKAPIAIHAQFMKHTVGFSHNTLSRRYVSDTPDFFTPTFRAKPTGNVKQGSSEVITTLPALDTKWATEYPPKDTVTQEDLQGGYRAYMQSCIAYYEDLIKLGVSPEQARFVLPQGVMTEWVSTGSLYAWARLYNLRADSHAQQEIQQLAKMIADIIAPLFPHSWQALTRGNYSNFTN